MYAHSISFATASGDLDLLLDGDVMMSDTENERLTNRQAVIGAHGDVLIAGLGIGMILIPMLQRPEVRSVTVLEKSADVIALVEPAIREYTIYASKLAVIEADCFAWVMPKGLKWDWIYFDIWPDICTDNLPEIAQLKRKYSRRLNSESNPNARMFAWCETKLRAKRRRERHENLYAYRCGRA